MNRTVRSEIVLKRKTHIHIKHLEEELIPNKDNDDRISRLFEKDKKNCLHFNIVKTI